MKFITSNKRIIASTFKQIKRSGWLAWASILVMALAFFIAIIFSLIAFTSNLFLQSIENEPHIYVFFKVGTEEEAITELQRKWEQLSEVELVEYTSEISALSEFKDAQARQNPQVAESLRTDVLPSSLGIRLFSIDDADHIIETAAAEKEVNENILEVRFNKKVIDTIKSLFYWVRIAGMIIMALLLIVIFAFTLLTVEFRTFNRAEEIGIMQLVGGSLWFIRSPFILEGSVYGFIGSLISSSIVYILAYVIFVVNRDSGAVNFIVNFFGRLRWPYLNLYHIAGIFVALLALGTIIGALNSYLAIRRYIK